MATKTKKQTERVTVRLGELEAEPTAVLKDGVVTVTTAEPGSAGKTIEVGVVSSAAHTPGPWSVAKNAAKPSARTVSAPNGPRLGRTVAFVDSGARVDEDAALIAAAPDLLAACEALLEIGEGFDDADHHDDEEPIVAPILAKARAAIAKAKNSGTGTRR